MSKNTDHIVLDANIGGALRCLHCGDTYLPRYPIAVADYVALSDSFVKRHKRCKSNPKHDTQQPTQ